MGTMIQLPHGSSPHLEVVHPTQEELEIQFRHNGAEWRGALNLDAYLRREAVLSSQALTKNGGITYWILIDLHTHNVLDPSSPSRLPLASCETYRKRALVWKDGKVQETITHGIGSVFCASHLRKRGYAQRLMTEVGRALETYQTTAEKPCLFSVLYSDIGKKFYADMGWEPYESSDIKIPGVARHIVGLPDVRPLYKDDLEELCILDEEMMRKRLEARPKDSIAVALCPDVDTMRWHHAREDFVGNELHGKIPEIKGAMVGSEKGKRVWCYWTRVWYNQNPEEAKENTFYILRLVCEDEAEDNTDAIAAILALAQREAQEWRMEDVEVWNPSQETVAAAQRLHPTAKVVDREKESIASLRWYPESSGPVEWVCIEKYVWC